MDRYGAGDIDLRNIKTISSLDNTASPDRRLSSIGKNDMFIVGEDQVEITPIDVNPSATKDENNEPNLSAHQPSRVSVDPDLPVFG